MKLNRTSSGLDHYVKNGDGEMGHTLDIFLRHF